MNSENGGQSSDLSRQDAAQLARRRVLAAYSGSSQKTAQEDKKAQPRLKDTPVTPQIDAETWKKYHSAWQNYYQKYYNDYYSKAAQNYIAKERLKDAREKAEEEEILNSLTKFSKKTGQKAGMTLGTEVMPEESAEESSERSEHTTFAAFAPFDDPRIAITVYVPFGSGDSYPAPNIAKSVISKYINMTSSKQENNYNTLLK